MTPLLRMDMDLSNFNARVRGLRGRLLKRPDYEALLVAGNLAEFAERIRGTPYGPYMEAAKARRPSSGGAEGYAIFIEAALASSLSGAFELLARAATKDAARFFMAFMAGWEVYGIKTIIRGIAGGVKRDEILPLLIPAGGLDMAAIKHLLAAKDVDDVIAFLDTWGLPYAEPLKRGLPEYKKSGSLAGMEAGLDIFLYGHLRAVFKSRGRNETILRDMLRMRIDTVNIMTLMKTAGEGYASDAVAGFFIEGGFNITKDEFARLSWIKNRDELASAAASVVGDAALGAMVSTADADDMNLLEEAFEELLEGRLRKTAVVEPLSIALAASYIGMKTREVKNLRLIARAKAFAIPVDEIKRNIFYPL
ncbi:MAG: V-type ATPase subunit [Deltaproteobacteria bacterium]|nr:V-type ATPase subunit [Deltaproteobacteria bacterium]